MSAGHVHTIACYGPVEHPCPSCGTPVRQHRLACGPPDTASPAECLVCELRCPECPSEVRITEGSSGYRARVIHTAQCPWLPRYLAGTLDPRTDYTGAIPCGTVVTHRGPYKRDPDRRAA